MCLWPPQLFVLFLEKCKHDMKFLKAKSCLTWVFFLKKYVTAFHFIQIQLLYIRFWTLDRNWGHILQFITIWQSAKICKLTRDFQVENETMNSTHTAIASCYYEVSYFQNSHKSYPIVHVVQIVILSILSLLCYMRYHNMFNKIQP